MGHGIGETFDESREENAVGKRREFIDLGKR